MNSDGNEQEKYIASHGHRESEQVKTDTSAVMEWAWKLKSEHSRILIDAEPVGLFRNVPRY